TWPVREGREETNLHQQYRALTMLKDPRRARSPVSYRPELLSLEERLPLGDALLSVALGQSLLGPGLTGSGLAAWSVQPLGDVGTPVEHGSARPETGSAAPETD